MNQYLTPLKDSNQTINRQTKTQSQTRDGDWVCYNCNNLNFSFRKKCNRCKTQTKGQNQQIQAYYYHYYPKECYGEAQKENFPTIQTGSMKQEKQEEKEKVLSSCQSSQKRESTPDKKMKGEQLPSVSPLVKRYNRHQNNSTEESKGQGLFQNEGLWANIDTNYLEQGLRSDKGEVDQTPGDMEEIQRIIQRIML